MCYDGSLKSLYLFIYFFLGSGVLLCLPLFSPDSSFLCGFFAFVCSLGRVGWVVRISHPPVAPLIYEYNLWKLVMIDFFFSSCQYSTKCV
ncbi:hypothetical protein ACE6H2_008920 [Prunus campanulata]